MAAQRFIQRAWVDISEKFSPVVKLSTMSTVLTIAGNMLMHSGHIETAFLSAHLLHGIYMRQSRGAEDGTPRVMRLLKSIYGRSHASRGWSKLFH
jgi:hypothetical protein